MAAEIADVVVLAVRWGAAEKALRAAGDLNGKILIDNKSAGPRFERAGRREHVVRRGTGRSLDRRKGCQGVQDDRLRAIWRHRFFRHAGRWLYCGDDIAAKMFVSNLIAEIGMDPVDVGPLRNARLLEPMALLWIDLANNRGWGKNQRL